jgi:hypothetical protein
MRVRPRTVEHPFGINKASMEAAQLQNSTLLKVGSENGSGPAATNDRTKPELGYR